MPHRETAKPFIFFFLVLPYGISSGFVSITLPFVLTRAGFSVATALPLWQLAFRRTSGDSCGG
jgi:hypothetical protein